jgi:hypothetical protein
MRAFVICFVKAIFIALTLGLLASFCRNIIISEILQPSRSKSLLLKVVGPLSPILRKISALFIRNSFTGFRQFCRRGGEFSYTNYFTINSRRFGSI